ncbi:MAG: hypothetical protein IT200_09190 [Thermoleophilia bacterium]|nr:hypothetical protein [Thermoleophilia bacterium]
MSERRYEAPGKRTAERRATVGGPPWQLPVTILAAAAAAQVAGTAALALAAPDLASGVAYGPAQLGAVHLLGLGFLTAAILGALLQLVPVLFRRVLMGAVPASLTAAALVGGSWALALGLWAGDTPAIAVGGTLVVVALTALTAALVNVLVRAARAGNAGAPGAGMALAATWLATVAVLGGVMAANRVDPFLDVDRMRLIGAHAVVALVGWIGGAILAMALRLAPMFALSHGYPRRPGTVALALWHASVPPLALGLLLDLTPVVVAGGVLLLAGVAAAGRYVAGVARHRRRRVEAPLVHLVIGLASAAGACLIPGIAWVAGASVVRASIPAVLLLAVGLGCGVTSGHLFKVVPMLVWTGRWADLAGTPGVPTLSDLVPQRIALAEQAAFAAGLAALVGGVAAHAPAVARAGAVLLCAASLAVAAAVAVCASARRPRPEDSPVRPLTRGAT